MSKARHGYGRGVMRHWIALSLALLVACTTTNPDADPAPGANSRSERDL